MFNYINNSASSFFSFFLRKKLRLYVHIGPQSNVRFSLIQFILKSTSYKKEKLFQKKNIEIHIKFSIRKNFNLLLPICRTIGFAFAGPSKVFVFPRWLKSKKTINSIKVLPKDEEETYDIQTTTTTSATTKLTPPCQHTNRHRLTKKSWWKRVARSKSLKPINLICKESLKLLDSICLMFNLLFTPLLLKRVKTIK